MRPGRSLDRLVSPSSPRTRSIGVRTSAKLRPARGSSSSTWSSRQNLTMPGSVCRSRSRRRRKPQFAASNSFSAASSTRWAWIRRKRRLRWISMRSWRGRPCRTPSRRESKIKTSSRWISRSKEDETCRLSSGMRGKRATSIARKRLKSAEIYVKRKITNRVCWEY